ncbi:MULTISPECIES: hypothetical protein [Nocardia]|uniref:hypothetical protein n=1 Tax=Nocardia TaxID=1817 RepID=UPI001358D271|nr:MULTISPECIES: hypothetical protein [Nocardia]
MTLINVARACAIPVSLWLPATLILDPGYRANNIFAAPDFGFSLVLLIAAFLPRRTALPSLMAGYFFGSGVITIAALDRFYRSESVRGIVDSIIAATYLSVALLLFHRIGRTGTDAAERWKIATADRSHRVRMKNGDSGLVFSTPGSRSETA